MPPRPAAARGAAPSPPAGGPRSSSGNESGGKKKHKKKNKKKRRREGDNFTPSSHQHVGAQHAVSQRAASRDNPPSASGTAHSAKTTPSSKKNTRAKEIPARFTHPQLDSELRRLRRSWLSPGDPLFRPALDVSYRGMRHVPAPSLPPAIHKGFRESFDGLHEAGLFMYDTVQAGGKRLSKTFVTRTLLGDPGITYKVRGGGRYGRCWRSSPQQAASLAFARGVKGEDLRRIGGGVLPSSRHFCSGPSERRFLLLIISGFYLRADSFAPSNNPLPCSRRARGAFALVTTRSTLDCGFSPTPGTGGGATSARGPATASRTR